MTAPVSRCPSCKFALRKGDTKFGRPPWHSRYLTDRAGRLVLNEIPKLREELAIFEEKFPQSLFSVFITELSPGTPVAEYAFWLANRGRFSSIEAVGSENFDLLLVIDALAGAAALTVGYGLEKYFEENDLAEILAAAASTFREGDFAGGILICIDRTIQRMREISVQTQGEKAARKSGNEMATATQSSARR
ncbi:MAG: TPM domain-containing protein [Verrucomicrobiota bacterium]